MSARGALAGLLVAASFLSGVAVPAGGFHVRPEQAVAPLVALAALLLPRRGRVPRVALLAVVFLAAGVFGALGEPEAGRALEHAARLAATLLPLALLPLLLDAPGAERAWDLFLLCAVLASAVGLGAAAAHRAFGTTWGVTQETRLGYFHPQGTLLEPNILGALSAAAAVALFLRVLDPALAAPRRAAAASGFALCTAATLASMTRAAWIALPLALGTAALLRAPRGRRLRLAAAGLAFLVLAGAAGGLALAMSDAAAFADARTGVAGKVASFARLRDDPNVAVRLRTYEAAMALFSDRPLLGAGHGAMERIPGTEDARLSWAGNLELHLLADTGLLGLVAVLALAAAVLARSAARALGAPGRVPRRRAIERTGALVVLFLCAQATETSWLASFWVMLGLALAADTPAPGERPMRVLFVHPSDELYGSDRVLLDLVAALPRERVEPLVLVSSDVAYEGRLSARLAALGVPVRRFRLGVLRRRTLASPFSVARLLLDGAAATLRVASLVVRERVDVVHANTVTVIPAAFAARLAGRPLVWHIHEIVPERPLRGLLLRAVDLLATQVVAVSHAAKEALGPAAARAVVLENGVSVPQASPEPGEPGLVVFAGRLSERKGVDVLVEAAALLRETHPAARYLLVGDEFAGATDFRAALDRIVEGRDLAARVAFAPFTEDLAPVLARAGIAVNPSRVPEPFGLWIAEAMAAGRPVVASAAGGPSETIEDGVSGLLVPPGDAPALAAALDRLLSDPAAARAMGLAARARVAARYPVARVAQRFLGVYAACGAPAAPAASTAPGAAGDAAVAKPRSA